MYFAVGSSTALHSGIWKAWTQGDEFYAAEITGEQMVYKLSVHSSGVCRLANVEPLDVEWAWDRDPRVIKRWNIARVGAEDYDKCFGLLVPSVFIPDRLGVPEWVPARRASGG